MGSWKQFPASNAPVVKDFTVVHKIGSVAVLSLRFSNGSGGYVAICGEVRRAGSSARLAVHYLRLALPRKPRPIKGEIIAYRIWQLVGDNLRPVAADSWDYVDGPVLVADKPPTMANKTGFWAVKKSMINKLAQSYHYQVVGAVGLFGRVVEHELGWRAHKMVIRKLILRIPTSLEFQRLLSQKYQCDVVENYTMRHGVVLAHVQDDWEKLL